MFDGELRAALEQAAGRAGTSQAVLADFTTMGCGGPAAFLIEAEGPRELAAILEVAEERRLPWFVLGRGSNLLVADSGYSGLVIKLSGSLKQCQVEGERLRCGGAAMLPKAAALAAERGLTGLEPLSCVPGTLGGAVAMNAGAYGRSISELLTEVELCLPGRVETVPAAQLQFGYRSSGLPAGAIVSGAVLELTAAPAADIAAAMQRFRQQRDQTQPRGQRTCGSTFKNPPGRSAGALLDQAGCKGLTSGGAAISELHANFFVNRGGASAADVLSLMDRCRRRVYQSFQIVLEPEVKLLGDIGLSPLDERS